MKIRLMVFTLISLLVFGLSLLGQESKSIKQGSDENEKSIWKKFEFNGGLGGVQYTLYDDSTYRYDTWADVVIPGETPFYFDGKYNIDSDKVTLFALKRGYHASPEDVNFFIITWGKLVLFVEENEMINLCNIYNSGMYPLTPDDEGFFLFDTFGPALVHEAGVPHEWLFGKPTLPLPWSKYLFDSSLKAEITEIDTIKYEVWINKGTIDGVFLGCELYTLCRTELIVVDTSLMQSKCKPEDDLNLIRSLAKSVATDEVKGPYWQNFSRLRFFLDVLHEQFKCLNNNTIASTAISDISKWYKDIKERLNRYNK